MTDSDTSYTIETEQQLWDGTPAANHTLIVLLPSLSPMPVPCL